jgi:hypothetical protein
MTTSTAAERQAAFSRARDTIIDGGLSLEQAEAIRAGLARHGLDDDALWPRLLATLRRSAAPVATEVEPVASSSALRPIPASEILSTEYAPLRFLVPGLIVDGLTLLAGRPKVGKSWLALCLAVAVTCGGQFLGRTASKAGVLYLGLEDSPRRIKKRLLELNLTTAPENLNFLFRLPRLDEMGAEALACWLTEHPEVKLVLLDVLNRIRGSRPKRADPYQHDATEIALLQAVAQEKGIALVVMTHDRKANAEDWLERVTGTLGVAGSADTVALLERDRRSTNGRLRIVGRDLDEEPDLSLEFRNGLWHHIGPGETLDLTLERRAILGVLPRDGDGLSPKQISLATELSGKRVPIDTVKHALPALLKAGFARKIGTGKYTAHSTHSETPI